MTQRRLLRAAAAAALVCAIGATTVPALAAGHAPRARSRVPATYAIGDSVLIDAQDVLHRLVPKVRVNAVVSRQFADGLTIVQHLRAEHRLTSRFVIFLGTNGYIEKSQFVEMLRDLRVCKRVVLVTLWVPTREWMRANNDLIRTGPRRQRNVVIADWTRLARAHPGWFYSDRVHLPIDGPGATALAKLIARTLA